MTALPEIARRETFAQQAHASLRQAIREGVLRPDQLYSEGELAGSMGISRTPVREALLELAREGLVEILPQRGFRLRSVTAEERAEVFGLRLALESYVVEQLSQRATAGDVAQLRTLVRRQAQAVDDPDEFLRVDERFHLLMPRLIALERTHRILATLRGVMWLMGTQALTSRERAPRVLEEHVQIVNAVAAGHPQAAVGAIRDHLGASVRAVAAEADNGAIRE